MTLSDRDQQILKRYLARRANWRRQSEEPDQPEPKPKPPHRNRSLDTKPWIEHEQPITQTQDQWIEKYNAAGQIMAAAPDFYAAIKTDDNDFITILREDLKNWLALSTRITYNPNSLEDTIIHYHNSTVIAPISSHLVIPLFNNTPIEEAIVTGSDAVQGLAYLQTYFGTQDSAEQIIRTLEKVSEKPKDKIKIWTASSSTQATQPDRAAFVGFVSVDCDVYGNGNLLYCFGRSRGVAPEAPARDILGGNQ